MTLTVLRERKPLPKKNSNNKVRTSENSCENDIFIYIHFTTGSWGK
jgi:hypothetical protein